MNLTVLCQYLGHSTWTGNCFRNIGIRRLLVFLETSSEPWFICHIIVIFHSGLGIKYILLPQMGFLGEYFLMRFNGDIE